LGQILAQQAERPPHGDDVHRHEELVQDQNAGVQSRVGTGMHKAPFLWWRAAPATEPAPAAAALPKDAPGRSRVRCNLTAERMSPQAAAREKRSLSLKFQPG